MNEQKNVRWCKRCVMNDASDKEIRFDENGYCNYCTRALRIMPKVYFPNEIGKRKIEAMVEQIKRDGKDKPYDCIIGLSGGLDSSYLTYLCYTWGLRILAVHIDDGFDTEISKQNIKKLCNVAHVELRTVTPDAEQFNALTLAYMKAGVANLDIPQDNTLFGFLCDIFKQEKVGYLLSGGNFSTESILQEGVIFDCKDLINLQAIHSRFGTQKIDKLKFISQLQWQKLIKTVGKFTPLDYLEYNRDKVLRELNEFCDFEYYGRKHLENILTAFIQCYWFPKKFGVDKRTSHLSSMIVSGQITREQAMQELQEPLYDTEQMNGYIDLIKERFGITDREFDQIMAAETHQHTDYPYNRAWKWLQKIKHDVLKM